MRQILTPRLWALFAFPGLALAQPLILEVPSSGSPAPSVSVETPKRPPSSPAAGPWVESTPAPRLSPKGSPRHHPSFPESRASSHPKSYHADSIFRPPPEDRPDLDLSRPSPPRGQSLEGGIYTRAGSRSPLPVIALDLDGNGFANDLGREGSGQDAVLLVGLQSLESETPWYGLTSQDSNQDGVVDASDYRFSRMKLWQDANGDHFPQAHELSSLSSKVRRIRLPEDPEAMEAEFETLDGESRPIWLEHPDLDLELELGGS